MNTESTNDVTGAPPVRSSDLLDDGILVRLLEMDAAHDKKVEQLEKAIGTAETNLYLDGLLDIVLDALGVPADNTVETNACDIANDTGEWPDGSYCRDFWYWAWWDTKRGESETTIENFPAWVREQLTAESSNDPSSPIARQ